MVVMWRGLMKQSVSIEMLELEGVGGQLPYRALSAITNQTIETNQ